MPCAWVGLDSVANWIMWIKIIKQCFPWRGWSLANALSPQCWVTRKEREHLEQCLEAQAEAGRNPSARVIPEAAVFFKSPEPYRLPAVLWKIQGDRFLSEWDNSSSLNRGFVPIVETTKYSTVQIKEQIVLFKENVLGIPERWNILEKPVKCSAFSEWIAKG